MKLNHRLALLHLLLIALLAPTGCHGPLNARGKERILTAVGRRIERTAYVENVDFSRERWRQVVTENQETLDKAETDKRFADAIDNALEAYDISHLDCLSPEYVSERKHGKRSGIGVIGIELDDGLLVAEVIKGSPAEAAGIGRGDKIITIDGMPMRERKQLYGDVGQAFALEWLHNGERLTGTVVRAEFRRASPDELIWLDDNIALIRVHSFGRNLYNRRQIEQFFIEAADATGIIMDLRSNLGGRVANVVHLAGQVLEPGVDVLVVVSKSDYRRFRKKNPDKPATFEALRPYAGKVFKTKKPRRAAPYRGKIVMLVNAVSGSGGELFPACIQDAGRGIVIGTVTFGKVLLASYYSLPRGYRLHVPFAEIFTTSGWRLEGAGVQPDFTVTHEEATDDAHLIRLARRVILR